MKVKTIIAGVSALTMVAYSMPLSMIDMNQMIVSAAEAADNVPTIEFDTNITAKPGEKVKVNAYISNYANSKYDGYSIKWNHDKELQCLDKVKGDNVEIISKENFAWVVQSSTSGTEVNTNREILFTVTYVIPENAKPGTEYKLSWADPNEYGFVFDYAKKNIECNFSDGVIKIVSDKSDENNDKNEKTDLIPTIGFDTEITGRPGKKVKVNVYLSNYEKSVFDSFSLRWNHDKELKCMEVPGEDAVIASTEKFAQAIYSSDGIEVETNREKLFTVAYVIPEDAKPGTEYKLSWADTNDYNFAFLNTAASKNNIECKLTDGVIRVVADNNSDTGTDKTPDNSTENLPLVLGDVNLDGKVDITDLSILSIALVDKKPLSEKVQKASDVNRDGEVDLTDLATIKQFISKIIESFDAKPDDSDKNDSIQETVDWRKLYASKLNEYAKSSDAMFDLVDMNGDSIPELLVSDGTMHPARVTIYSVNENSLTELGSYGEYGVVSFNPTIGRICSRWMNQGIIESVYYKMEKNEIVKIYSSSTNAGAVASKDEMYFEINGENVTPEEYEKIESENPVDGWDGYGRKYEITADVISRILN